MDPQAVRALLEGVRQGTVPLDEAERALAALPVEEVGSFAVLDTHRQLRTGVPEAVYCAGKTPAQVAEIVARLTKSSSPVLATRVGDDHLEAVRATLPDPGQIEWHAEARILQVGPSPPVEPDAPFVLVLAAGTSDLPVAEEAAVVARALGSRVERCYDVGVAGLHRLLGRLELVLAAEVLVVAAGMEGALPSVVGGLVSRPVIAVPTSVGYGAHFGGLAPLLTMLNSCAPGVAVVNIDNGFGAGVLAHRICARAPRESCQQPAV